MFVYIVCIFMKKDLWALRSLNSSFRSQNKNSFHSFYLLTPLELWKNSPTRSNWYSNRSESSSLVARRWRSGHSRQPSDMPHLVRYPSSSISSSPRGGSTEIARIRSVYLPTFAQIVTRWGWSHSSGRSLAGCRYSPTKISRQRSQYQLDLSLLLRSIFFSEPKETRWIKRGSTMGISSSSNRRVSHKMDRSSLLSSMMRLHSRSSDMREISLISSLILTILDIVRLSSVTSLIISQCRVCSFAHSQALFSLSSIHLPFIFTWLLTSTVLSSSLLFLPWFHFLFP
jgi:hypothetical protein